MSNLYTFDPDEATRYGYREAIILSILRRWGRNASWMGAGQRRRDFPFWSARQSLHYLRSLRKQGVIAREMNGPSTWWHIIPEVLR